MNYSDIFLKDSLYTEYDLESFTEEAIMNILYHNENSPFTDKFKTLDSYCTVCKKNTTFISKQTSINLLTNIINFVQPIEPDDEEAAISIELLDELEKIGTFERVFRCPRPESNASHDLIFIFRVINHKLIKIGQSPSLADLVRFEIKRYRKLDENIYQELNRAIGLSSHGIGVGTFVYLRRIIEKHIVLPKIQELVKEGKISQDEVNQADFKKKIDLAKDRLPDFLVSNKTIYSILSKGIHELEEDECKNSFPVLKASIEIILDEKIEKKEREEKNKIIIAELNKLK